MLSLVRSPLKVSIHGTMSTLLGNRGHCASFFIRTYSRRYVIIRTGRQIFKSVNVKVTNVSSWWMSKNYIPKQNLPEKKNKKTNVSSKKEFLQQINMGVPNVNFFKCLSGWPLLAIQKFTFQGYNETYIYISISLSLYIYLPIFIQHIHVFFI